MKIEKIDVATNGFVLHDMCGDLHVATSLTAAAVLAGEELTTPTATVYAQDYSIEQIRQVSVLMRTNRKIDAIKLLRDCFMPRLGLKEAKELAEYLG